MQASGKLGPGFNEDMFLFVESPDKQKKAFLCDLRTSAVNPSLQKSAQICGKKSDYCPQWRHVFVCRYLPTDKKPDLLADLWFHSAPLR